MKSWSRMAARTLLFAACAALASSQSLPMEPQHEAGSSITGAFEGWFHSPDGGYGLLVGYYNRNQKQEIDIPIGPNNRIEPGGPDRGQPTHFMPGRGWGMFTIKVPANFGTDKLTWTLVVNGQTTTIPLTLKPDWEISPFTEAGAGNTPPVIRFEDRGASIQGPGTLVAERTAKVGTPLSITAWLADDTKYAASNGSRPKAGTPPVTLRWTLYRGPGPVTLSNARPPIEKLDRSDAAFSGKSTITALFSEPGDYILHLSAFDLSGEGGSGFQCCWTTAQLKVAVGR
jgi:hypothetical protein